MRVEVILGCMILVAVIAIASSANDTQRLIAEAHNRQVVLMGALTAELEQQIKHAGNDNKIILPNP